LSAIVDTIICYPFGAVLRFIYQFVGSYGLAIILFTILTKLVILPFTLKSKRGMADMQRLQPKLKALEKQYASTNRAKYQEEVAKLYQQENISPMGSCLPTFITLPIMIGLYYVIQRPLSFIMGLSGDEIATLATRLGIAIPESAQQFQLMEIQIASEAFHHFPEVSSISDKLLPIDFNFLGLNLAQTPQWNAISWLWIIPVLSGVTALLMNKLMTKMTAKISGGPPQGGNQMAIMNAMMPVMSIWFGFILPAGVGLYWITSNLVMGVQEVLIGEFLIRENDKKEAAAAKEREAREKVRKQFERERALENQRIQKEMQEKEKKKGGKGS